MDRIARTQARNSDSKPQPPSEAGSSRGTAQRTRTPQAKQARRSLFPTSGVNQTIEKRGSPEGPRPGPWGPPGEGKRVSKTKAHKDFQARPARASASRPKQHKPARQGQTPHDPSKASPPGQGKRLTTQATQARPARANASRRKRDETSPGRPTRQLSHPRTKNSASTLHSA